MANRQKGGNIAAVAYKLAKPIADELGLGIWDITYEKEGALRYLRVLIERPGGSIDMDDCEAMTRPLSKALDEADPIEEQYILEVGSPGLGRQLRKKEHFEEYRDCPVRIRYIREHEGVKEFIGIIRDYDEGTKALTVLTEKGDDTEEIQVKLSETAFVRLYDDEDIEGAE